MLLLGEGERGERGMANNADQTTTRTGRLVGEKAFDKGVWACIGKLCMLLHYPSPQQL